VPGLNNDFCPSATAVERLLTQEEARLARHGIRPAQPVHAACILEKDNGDGSGRLTGSGFAPGRRTLKIKNNTDNKEDQTRVDVDGNGQFTLLLSRGLMESLSLDVGDEVTVTIGNQSCTMRVIEKSE
jgi:hypothetical protein